MGYINVRHHLIKDNPEIKYILRASFILVLIFSHVFQWEPSRLDLIRDDDVARYFSKIDDEDWEDLKLPPRSNLPPHAIAKL